MDQPTADASIEPLFLLELEQPAAGASVVAGERQTGFGWLLAAAPVRSVTIHLDGRDFGSIRLCDATHGLARADIAARHPRHHRGAQAGFMFDVVLPREISGPAALRVLIRTNAGDHTHIVPVEVVAGPAAGARPELMPRQLEIETAGVARAGGLRVRGWTVGVRPTRTVEIRVGDRSIGFADPNLPRADVAAAWPQYEGADRAGFELKTRTPCAGLAGQRVTVIVTDSDGESAEAWREIEPSDEPETAARPMLAQLEEARVNERGLLRVRGWALCLSAIEEVRVFVGETAMGVAETSLSRGDVSAAHPDYPGADAPGFLFQQEWNADGTDDAAERGPDEAGGSVVRVVITALGGIRRELTAPLVVAPLIGRLGQDASVHFYCDTIRLGEDGLLSITGWAVCPSGVASITVALGDIVAGDAELGRARPDVGNRFPNYRNSRAGGFRFDGRLSAACTGEHIVSITVRGRDGEHRTIPQPVLAQSPLGGADAAPGAGGESEHIKFFLDAPAVAEGRAVEPVRGFLSLQGWAFARTGIAGVEVFIDGRSQGEAYFGIRREDLQAAFPNWDALRSGFAMVIPPQAMRPGRHDVRVVVRDKAGHSERVAFTIEAEAADEGPGPWQLRSKMPQAETDVLLAVLAAGGWRPAWTLLLPVAKVTPRAAGDIRATIASLRHQAYAEWHLTVAVPAQADAEAFHAGLLSDFEELAPRVSVRALAADTPLSSLAPAEGLLAVLGAGDRLGEDALLEMSVTAAERGRPDFIYSDDRRADPADGVTRAFFKPDCSPDLLLSTDYIGRLWAATPAVLARAALRLGELTALGNHDAALRLTEQATGIVHVPKVLCAWAGEPAKGPSGGKAALRRAAARRGIAADILPGCLPGIWRMRRTIATEAMVSIIIPSNGSRGLVRTTVGSIRACTDWPRIEIILLDNIRPDAEPERLACKAWMREAADVVIELDEDFNWSGFNNRGAARATGEFLLFLNDDIEVQDPSWLRGLIAQAQRPDVGVVGPQLRYPDGRVQHAGMFLAQAEGRIVGRHAFRFYPADAPGPFGLALTQRNVIGVTGACMLMRRAVFEEAGGFDEAHAVVNNDLDFALRLRRLGKLVVYTPEVSLIHHEMVSREALKDSYDTARFDAAWKDAALQGDPYFHPLLNGACDDYAPEAEPLRQFQAGHPLMHAPLVRRILAVKLDHIGDFIAAFPALQRIRRHFPQAELVVLAARASVALAKLEPAIDRLIVFDFFDPRSENGRLDRSETDLAALERTLAPERFDIAIDLRRQADTRAILRRTGARWLAGFDQDFQFPWLDITAEFEGDVARSHKRSHVSDALIQLVEAVATACDADRRVIRDPMAADEARAALAAWPATAAMAPALCARPIVCIHTGAGAENKQWPVASFAGLIDLLVAQDGVNVLLVGGADEAACVEALIGGLRRADRVFSLAGRIGLGDLPAALRACALYVGNDSGPKHMAAALGVPTIGIHSGSVDAAEWGPMGPLTLTLRREMSCGPCYIARAADCPRQLACLHGISVGDVYRACQRMLAVTRDAAAGREAGTAVRPAAATGGRRAVAPRTKPRAGHV